jgi:hypothetical protein
MKGWLCDTSPLMRIAIFDADSRADVKERNAWN